MSRSITLKVSYETREGWRPERELEVEQAMVAALEKHLLDMPEAYAGNNANGPIAFVTEVEQVFTRPIEYNNL